MRLAASFTGVARLAGVSDVLTAACRAVDPQSTDELLEELVEGA